MKERIIELPQEVELELRVDIEATVEVLGNLGEISLAKQTNIDRTYIPLD